MNLNYPGWFWFPPPPHLFSRSARAVTSQNSNYITEIFRFPIYFNKRCLDVLMIVCIATFDIPGVYESGLKVQEFCVGGIVIDLSDRHVASGLLRGGGGGLVQNILSRKRKEK